MSGRRNAGERLRYAVDWIRQRDAGGFYPLDDDQRTLVNRLELSRDAAQAFDGLASTDLEAEKIIRTCVEAVLTAREAPSIDERESRFLKERAPLLLDAIGELEQFLSDLDNEPGPLDGWVHSPELKVIARDGLSALSGLVESRRWLAEDTRLRLGLTRKRHAPARRSAEQDSADVGAESGAGEPLDPATLSAVAWLAWGVERATKRPQWGLTAQLANVVLGLPAGTIDPENLRKTTGRRQEAYGDHRSTIRTVRRSK